MRKIMTTWILGFILAMSLTGCVAEVHSHPPPPRAEVRPPRPYPGAFWVEGHWRHHHHDWIWMEGHWERRH